MYISSYTTNASGVTDASMLWFAFNYWCTLVLIQHTKLVKPFHTVVICFQLLMYISSYTTFGSQPVGMLRCDLLSIIDVH